MIREDCLSTVRPYTQISNLKLKIHMAYKPENGPKSVLLLNCSNLRNIIKVLLFMEQVRMYDRA